MPTDAERIAVLEKRMDLLVEAVRREMSGLGRSFGSSEFDRLWTQAADEPSPDEEDGA